MPNPTIKDVAKKANVSIATVSLAIHDHHRISPDTKKKVLSAIKELNYHPSRSARGLVLKQTGNVGFILTNDHFLRTEPFYTRIFLGSEFEAHEKEFYLLLTVINSKYKRNNLLPRFILERNVDGLLIAGKVPDGFINKLKTVDIPIVFIDYVPRRLSNNYGAVLIDNLEGGMKATEHLINYGHKNIAFIGGDIDHPSIKDRLSGFKKALKNSGLIIDNDLIIKDENYPARENGYNAAKKLFKIKKDITAIFACNDAMAIGVMEYIKSIGLKIPEDISIIGFDDVEEDVSLNPPLSTIRVLKTEMGSNAIKLVSEMIKREPNGKIKKLVPVELIVRESTRRLK